MKASERNDRASFGELHDARRAVQQFRAMPKQKKIALLKKDRIIPASKTRRPAATRRRSP